MPEIAVLRTSRELFLATMAGDSAEVDAALIDTMASALEEEDVKAGTTIFAAGEPADVVYFMPEGRVKMTLESGVSWTLQGRWAFGGLEALLDKTHIRTATAVTDVHLLRLRADVWLDALETHFELARAILRNTARSVAALELRRWGQQDAPQGLRIMNVAVGRSPLQFMDRMAMLNDLPLFRHAGVQVLADVAHIMEEVELLPQQPLFGSPDMVERTFLLLEGEVVARHRTLPLSVTFKAGTGVCGLAALAEQLTDWDARATAPSRALTLTIEDWLDLMEEHFDLLRSALAALVESRDGLLEAVARQTPDLVLG